MPGDVDENCPGTLDPERVYVAFSGDWAVSGLLVMPIDDPEEVCIAAWNVGPAEREGPYMFQVRPTDGTLLAGYVTHDTAEYAALGLDWMSSTGDLGRNDVILASFEGGTSGTPFFAWGFDGDAIYFSGGYPFIEKLVDAEYNTLQPGFVGSFVTITEDGARWGFVEGDNYPTSDPMTSKLSRTSPSGEVSMFEAPLGTDGMPTRWAPYGARVVAHGGWLVVSHTRGHDFPGSPDPAVTTAERWTFGPQGLAIDGAWPNEALDGVKVDPNFRVPNTFVLDGEGTMVKLVPEEGASPDEWISVVRAPLDGEFETVLSLEDPVHGDEDFTVRIILGLVTGP